MGLKEIVENNQYPIIFVGSGMSKRYLSNAPDWTELLEKYWEKLKLEEDFYSYMINLKDELKTDHPEWGENEIEFASNVRAGEKIEKEFNKQFLANELKVKELTTKDVFENKISPFKYDLANSFKNAELKDNVDEEELKLYYEFLAKGRMIITTNYDDFIEKGIEEVTKEMPKVYNKNLGFFDESTGWSEVYKIHGSYTDSKSIVINKDDYDEFDKNSILISAKIISAMITAPIIFLGYSLKDRNVRKILSDFTRELPMEDSRKSANRITIVEYKENEEDIIEEIRKDGDLNFNYNLITTDNYKKLYNKLLAIDEGITPQQVFKFQKLIKQIIDTSGSKGELDAVLIDKSSSSDEKDNNKARVIAIGNNVYEYVQLNEIEYIKDYVRDESKIDSKVALKFVANQSAEYIPFLKHYKNINDVENIFEFSKDAKRMESRISKIKDNKYEKIKQTLILKKEYNEKQYIDISEVLSLKAKDIDKINILIKNADKFNFQKLTEYIRESVVEELEDSMKNSGDKQYITSLRKLLVTWDLLQHKDYLEKINNVSSSVNIDGKSN